MVAPTRAPQARGVKCELCKKILDSATWLDQTKPAKDVGAAQLVLSMIKQHNDSDCPCIPKNIENLLVGSTHFEIHRLAAKELDSDVELKQYESFAAKQRNQSENKKDGSILNDCHDCSRKESRFKIYDGYCHTQHIDCSKLQLRHLRRAIDYWRTAMDDQTHPFNSKLALRLGLTHHVIYACYLFKFYKILDYQVISANLLHNIFRSIEEVTSNAILHANFLLIKSLIDCDQPQLARHMLKQAMKISNYHDKSNYEAILVTCAACELNFVDGSRDCALNALDQLSDLVFIKSDDKLQHYYARLLAMSTILRYIHCYPTRSDQCLEFFHTFRYICAMIRRCYETSFDLALNHKNLTKKQLDKEQAAIPNSKSSQIFNHSWIRFAICDLVFTSFDLLTDFFTRTGMPECLDLIYNGLNLISYRNGGVYWQSRLMSVGARLDLLCDKYDDAKRKFDVLSRLVSYTDDSDLMNVIRLESEVGLLEMISQQGSIVSQDVIEDILGRIRMCRLSLLDRLQNCELYDVKSNSFSRLLSSCNNNITSESAIVVRGSLGRMSLSALNIGVVSSILSGEEVASKLLYRLRNQIGLLENQVLEFYECQTILEILLSYVNIDISEYVLIDAINASSLFAEAGDDCFDIQSQLSGLTLNGDIPSKNNGQKSTSPSKQKTLTGKRGSRIATKSRSKRKGIYEVAISSEKNLRKKSAARIYNVLETIAHFDSLTTEEIIVSYLRNSEPNPHYNLYRRAHELMLAHRLNEEPPHHESILYHFVESSSANTIRYRWMMTEEQTNSPYDYQAQATNQTAGSLNQYSLKQLGFCNILVNQGNVIKSMIRAIPDDTRFIQLNYILDGRTDDSIEHLLCVCIGTNHDESVYLHVRKSLTSDDFYDDAKIMMHAKDGINALTIPGRLDAKIDESRKSLLMKSNQRSMRSEARQEVEAEVGAILGCIENDWLGPFRFLFCGKISDSGYNNLTQTIMSDIQSYMADINKTCRSPATLKMTLENAPLLSREEFCQVIASLYNCDSKASQPRDCFNKWLKSFEHHMVEQNLGMNKTAYLRTLQRGQVGMILDKRLEMIPFESLSVVRIISQGIFRMPSLRIFSIMSTRRCLPIKINSSEVAYVLDPAHNLSKTREKFDNKLKSQAQWRGSIGQPPKIDDLESWLSMKQLYIFIGHGAGTAYYNQLCKGRGLNAMNRVTCSSIVMGCSSGRMLAEGPRLETFGISWMFLIRGSPCYVGLLWDVTDCDIDKFLDDLLDRWLPSSRRWSSSATTQHDAQFITDAVAQARNVCKLKLLVGATPVVYGFPILSCDNQEP